VVPSSSLPSPSSSAFNVSTTRASIIVVRPDSPILTSSVSYVQDTPQVATHTLDVQSTQCDGLESTAFGLEPPQDSERSDLRRSLISLDNILRHRDEVEKSIAALREVSPPCSFLYGGFSALDPPPTDIPASRTPSGNSMLSLSVFPDPPSNSKGFVNVVDSNRVDIITIRPPQPSFQLRRKRFNEFRSVRFQEVGSDRRTCCDQVVCCVQADLSRRVASGTLPHLLEVSLHDKFTCLAYRP
jgi:hypothetical protein